MEERRKGLTEDEIEKIAEALALKIEATRGECKLTEEQQKAVLELIGQKKKVVKVTLWIIGALVLWVLKDIYGYIIEHITWIRGVN